MATTATPIHVEIWSDVVCPWCYIGKRRFERALEKLAGEVQVDYVFRAFQLDPTASMGKSQPVVDAYAKKFGGPERNPPHTPLCALGRHVHVNCALARAAQDLGVHGAGK